MSRHFFVLGSLCLGLLVIGIFVAKTKDGEDAVLPTVNVEGEQTPEQQEPVLKENDLPIHEQKVLVQENAPDTLSMIELDAGISNIEQEIADSNLVARANSATLSEAELNHFRKLLKERDRLFAAKVELLLAD